ncbi:hypothetical protein TMES_16485 [Thalassospira mesophila]|uniref:DUF1289 domain-containing protein n=2 Tax=Thalassospira mesophila TaxID=1293891 RepID=A0A1Y2KXH3_9PROT|nr:DUF1289 domain-containing protein [Thalassospira mesophila]OSQ37070.1 hypothetical protein TMES_16485 [Thalassospira mesophila]
MSVSSPCVGICQLDTNGKVCTGCFRTIDEIGQWRTASDGLKKRILKTARDRQATTGSCKKA